MRKLDDVLRANHVEIVVRQQLDKGEWLLLIAEANTVSYPSRIYPQYILYANSRDPVEISDEKAEAIERRFRPRPRLLDDPNE